MRAALLLDELLAGFTSPAYVAPPDITPANPAKPANRQDQSGPALVRWSCDEKRKPANADPVSSAVESDAQRFAAIRKPQDRPSSQQRRELSQGSQPSQGLPRTGDHDDVLVAVVWSDSDISRFLDRRARMLRWGWPELEAEKMAERLTLRDRTADERVSCIECGNYKPSRCGNYSRAGLSGAELGRDLAEMLQRCPGFLSDEVPR